jgi:RNA polymerase sigma-70 factor (ECF subfamily)
MPTQNVHSTELTLWVETYGDELFSWAHYKTSNSALAEDLVQDTFLAAFNKFDTFKKESNPKTWLFTILNNKIIDHYRSAAYKKMVTESKIAQDNDHNLFQDSGMWNASSVSDWDSEPHLLDNPEFLAIMKSCLDHLPERWKAVTIAKYYEHKKGAEICKEMKITPSNLWQIVHRAKLQLKKCLDANWKDDA